MQESSKRDVTLVLPYWERFQVAKDTIDQWLELEPEVSIVLVDDGSTQQPFPTDLYPSDKVKVVSLPKKPCAKTPVVPYNVGVAMSETPLVILGGCDIRLPGPVVGSMLEHYASEFHYIQTSVKGPRNAWHAHSSYVCEYFPKGFNPNFCCLINKDQFMNMGGFDNAYRNGQAFDDTDFAWALKRYEFIPIQLDSLVCEHVKAGARSAWPAGAWHRNRAIFKEKWDL